MADFRKQTAELREDRERVRISDNQEWKKGFEGLKRHMGESNG